MTSPDLTTSEGVREYLSETPFAVQEISVLDGGSTNFTYWVSLVQPLQNAVTSVIVKHAQGYTAYARHWKTSAVRQDFEHKALTSLIDTPLFSPSSVVQLPKVYRHYPAAHILILEDLGALPTLKSFFSVSQDAATFAAAIGSALGEWLSEFHTYSQSHSELLTLFSDNHDGRFLSSAVYYGRLLSCAQRYGLGGDDLGRIAKVYGDKALSSTEVLNHGDFWTGNVLVKLPASEVDSLRLYIVNWELCKPGSAAFDVGQFTAEAYCIALFRDHSSAMALVDSFLRAYKQCRDVDAGKVAVRVGAHLVTTAPSVGWTQEKEGQRQVVQLGVVLVTKGASGDQQSLKDTVVAELFR